MSFLVKRASINYVDKPGEGRGSYKCQRYYKSLFSRLVNEGESEVKNVQNSVNVLYGGPQMLHQNFNTNLTQNLKFNK